MWGAAGGEQRVFERRVSQPRDGWSRDERETQTERNRCTEADQAVKAGIWYTAGALRARTHQRIADQIGHGIWRRVCAVIGGVAIGLDPSPRLQHVIKNVWH